MIEIDHDAATLRMCRSFDELEIYGSRRHLGYSYAYQARRRHTLELVAQAAPPARAARRRGHARQLQHRAGGTGLCRHLERSIRSGLIPYVRDKAGKLRIDFRSGNVFDLEPGVEYDVALVTEVIEHVARPDDFLRRIAALVRPGGHIVLSTPNGRYFRNRLPRFSECRDFSAAEARQFGPDADDHIFLLHPDELRDIVDQSGLELLDLRFHGNAFTAGALRSESLLRITPATVVEKLERWTSQLPAPLRERVNMGMAALLRRPA